MLSKFSVTNFKNFKEKLVLDFKNIKNYEFTADCIKDNMVKSALIYGINGCGKSNLAFAMFDIISHITDWEKKVDSYRDYINASSNNNLAEFEYIFDFDGFILCYSYGKINLSTLVYEKLTINGNEFVYYDKRDDNETHFKINFSGSQTLNTDLSQIKISVLKYIKTSTVLDDDENTQALQSFFSFVDNMLHFRSLDDRFYQGYEIGSVNIEEFIAKHGIEDFNKFLKDAGIKQKVVSENINGHLKLFMKFENLKIDFYSNASTGTQSLTLFYFWLQRAKEHKPSLLFIDEFDAFYHYELAEFIVRQLKKIDCQLILTTHNTRLLNNDLSRPDCCFILKNSKIKPLSLLTDKELREAHNIEKMYRAKVFDK